MLSVAKDIAGSVQEKVSRAEREHLLRKQLEAIQAELGEDDDGDEADLEKNIEKLGLPAEVLGQVTKELARLRKLPAASPERAVARTWLQWIVDLPWSDPHGGIIMHSSHAWSGVRCRRFTPGRSVIACRSSQSP